MESFDSTKKSLYEIIAQLASNLIGNIAVQWTGNLWVQICVLQIFISLWGFVWTWVHRKACEPVGLALSNGGSSFLGHVFFKPGWSLLSGYSSCGWSHASYCLCLLSATDVWRYSPANRLIRQGAGVPWYFHPFDDRSDEDQGRFYKPLTSFEKLLIRCFVKANNCFRLASAIATIWIIK